MRNNYSNSESRGLIQTGGLGDGRPQMAGINEEDFDDTSKAKRKMRISEAIEDADDGKKQGKKGKKKKKNAAKRKDNDMLNVQQVDDDNESWNSSRAHAKHINLGSNALASASPMGGFSSQAKMGMPEYYATGKAGGLSYNPSREHLSAQLDELDEVADHSNRGGRIDINDIDDGFNNSMEN